MSKADSGGLSAPETIYTIQLKSGSCWYWCQPFRVSVPCSPQPRCKLSTPGFRLTGLNSAGRRGRHEKQHYENIRNYGPYDLYRCWRILSRRRPWASPGATLTATTSRGFITITSMRRHDRFTLSITIVRLSWNDTITRRRFIMRPLHRAVSFSGCRLRMQDRRSVLV